MSDRWHSESTEAIWHKLVTVAHGDSRLAVRALAVADPEHPVPRLERIVDYIVEHRHAG